MIKEMEIKIDTKNIVNELDKGLGTGPLTLGIYCTECNAQFELNKEAVAMAVMMKTSFIEYLRYVQTSPCQNCERNEDAVD